MAEAGPSLGRTAKQTEDREMLPSGALASGPKDLPAQCFLILLPTSPGGGGGWMGEAQGDGGRVIINMDAQLPSPEIVTQLTGVGLGHW